MLGKFISIMLLAGILVSCIPAARETQPQEVNAVQPVETSTSHLAPVSARQATNTPLKPAITETTIVTATAEAQPAESTQPAAPTPVVDSSPKTVNPLTGLPVEDPDLLNYAPALVSITNFPVTARPQAGLSFSPYVFEMYIGEGMTRFLAVFYGEYPVKGDDAAITLDDDRIGPVRSGRLPYESLRQLYNGFLVMASASSNVSSNLNAFTNVWGSDTGDINSAMIPATRLEEIAAANPARVKEGSLSGLSFASTAPEGGKLANKLWIPFNYLNQVIWKYDPVVQAYLRYQDNADGQTFVQQTDRLNNDPLTYENVVILFAQHNAKAETLINIDFQYVNRMPALLFRDGKMYEIFWTTANGDFEKRTGLLRPIRFIDSQGNPFPLKPGQTWVEIVLPYTRFNETVDSETYIDLKKKSQPGSGVWAVHFYPSKPEK